MAYVEVLPHASAPSDAIVKNIKIISNATPSEEFEEGKTYQVGGRLLGYNDGRTSILTNELESQRQKTGLEASTYGQDLEVNAVGIVVNVQSYKVERNVDSLSIELDHNNNAEPNHTWFESGSKFKVQYNLLPAIVAHHDTSWIREEAKIRMKGALDYWDDRKKLWVVRVSSKHSSLTCWLAFH